MRGNAQSCSWNLLGRRTSKLHDIFGDEDVIPTGYWIDNGWKFRSVFVLF